MSSTYDDFYGAPPPGWENKINLPADFSYRTMSKSGELGDWHPAPPELKLLTDFQCYEFRPSRWT